MRLADEYANNVRMAELAPHVDPEPERASLVAAIVAYGDAQWKDGREVAAKECDYLAGNSAVARDLAKSIRGLKP